MRTGSTSRPGPAVRRPTAPARSPATRPAALRALPHGRPRALPRALHLAASLGAALLLAACGGEPPESLSGFRLGLTQAEVLDGARARGGFQCRLTATRPSLAECEGPGTEGDVAGEVRVLVRGDSAVLIALRLDPSGSRPARVVRRFTEPFGDPAWRDRPAPPRAATGGGYHTLWLDADSTRALALTCDAPDLTPPCTAELTSTSPARVQATLDSLLNIQR